MVTGGKEWLDAFESYVSERMGGVEVVAAVVVVVDVVVGGDIPDGGDVDGEENDSCVRVFI